MCCCESDDDEDGNGSSGNGGGLSSSLSAQATFNINSSGDERTCMADWKETRRETTCVFVQGLAKVLVRCFVKFIPVR